MNINGPKPRPAAGRFWEKVNKRSAVECWEWTGCLVGGYGMLRVGRMCDRTATGAKAHRLSWEFHYGKIPDNLHVLHHCDNRACVNPYHLFLGTNSINVSDKVSKGRQARGETSGQARLTESDIRKIRSLAGTMTQREIGEKFSVDRSHVSRILSRIKWGHA